MKKIFIILNLLICQGLVSQQIHFKLDYEKKQLKEIYLLQNKKVVITLNGNGTFKEILFFDTERKAKKFIKKPNNLLKPIYYVLSGEIPIYINDVKNLTFLKSKNKNLPTRIGNNTITYKIDPHSNKNKISAINEQPVTYLTAYQFNKGKINSIGKNIITYFHGFHSLKGLIKKVNQIPFIYQKKDNKNDLILLGGMGLNQIGNQNSIWNKKFNCLISHERKILHL